MTRFDNTSDVWAFLRELERRLHALEHATPQNNMTLSGTFLIEGDGELRNSGYAMDASQLIMPWKGGVADMSTAVSGVDGRMNPGGDMHSWATSISQVANSAHGVATSAQSTANGAANSLAPGGATNNWITAVSSVANAAHSIGSSAASAAAAAQTSANNAWNRAGSALSDAAAALAAGMTAQEMVRTLRRQVREAGVDVPAVDPGA